jgi:hypothetical protein
MNDNTNNNNDQTSITGHGRTSHSRGISRSRRQREYSQFHINQFYEAAEDEQLYTDEYLIFARDYNRFVTNSNIMFSRIEQGLRSNIARSITREYFYYNRHNELTRNTVLPGSSNYNDAANAAPAPAPAPAPTATAATAAERHVPDNNMFSRVILDYMNNVLNLRSRDDLSYNPMPREPAPQREQQFEPSIHPRPNRTAQSTRTQPYAVFFDLTSDSTNNNNDNHNNDNHNNNVLNRIFSDRNTNIPTAREIQAGTANTRFSNILAPTNSICPISHDEFIDTSEVTQIRGCSHIFNRTSLSEWFRTHSTCPMCRYDIRDYREISEPLHRMRTQASASESASANTAPSSNSASQRPDLGAIQSIVGNGNNIDDIYHRIMDNSSNFTNAIIENMNENMITFSYDLPSFYRGGDGDSDIDEVD